MGNELQIGVQQMIDKNDGGLQKLSMRSQTFVLDVQKGANQRGLLSMPSEDKKKKTLKRGKKGFFTKRKVRPRSAVLEGTIWLDNQRKTMQSLNSEVPEILQEAFKNLFHTLNTQIVEDSKGEKVLRKTVSRTNFLSVCKSLWGHDSDTYLFIKLFEIMDADKNGVVDEIEFSIVSCFLLNHGTNKTSAECAFYMFDSNHDGGMSQKEFGEMLAAVVGQSVDILLNVNEFRDVLEDFAKEQRVIENLDFYSAIDPYIIDGDDGRKFLPISMEKAQTLVERFIAEGAPQEINVSEADKNAVIDALERGKKAERKTLPSKIFSKCFDDVKALMSYNLVRPFKEHLRTNPFSALTHEVWARFELKANDGLSPQNFTEWVDETPNLFSFFEKMQQEFGGLLDTLYSKQLNLKRLNSVPHI